MSAIGDNFSRHGGYALGHSERELDRLSAQARLVDPITRQFFREAGLPTGCGCSTSGAALETSRSCRRS
jgi:hypothetical protein